MYAAVLGGASIFKVSKNVLILPMGAIVIVTSILFAGNYSAHMAQSHIVLKYVYPIFAAYIPLLLCEINFIKNKFKNKRS
jgi:spore germination protein KB